MFFFFFWRNAFLFGKIKTTKKENSMPSRDVLRFPWQTCSVSLLLSKKHHRFFTAVLSAWLITNADLCRTVMTRRWILGWLSLYLSALCSAYLLQPDMKMYQIQMSFSISCLLTHSEQFIWWKTSWLAGIKKLFLLHFISQYLHVWICLTWAQDFHARAWGSCVFGFWKLITFICRFFIRGKTNTGKRGFFVIQSFGSDWCSWSAEIKWCQDLKVDLGGL